MKPVELNWIILTTQLIPTEWDLQAVNIWIVFQENFVMAKRHRTNHYMLIVFYFRI